jgi:tetraacyldisaccharide 4'-kinase
MRMRNALYDRGWLQSFSVPAAVVSVGNLTVGGTGKTPLVEALALFFSEEGFRPAVVSRGYGRKAGKGVVVSDGKRILCDAEKTGDEPLLLARRLPGIPVLVDADRVAGAAKAARDFGCDLILLDDGFQHRRLRRDADVVVLRRRNPYGNGLVLPAGPLREPKRGLNRAQVLVLTGDGPEAPDIPPLAALSANPRPVHWVEYPSGREHPLDALRHRFVFAFSGIGNPESFARTLAELGVMLVGPHRAFRDHHRYSPGDVKRVAGLADSHGAVAVVTTEKDAVRLAGPWPGRVPLYYLRIRMEIDGGKTRLREAFPLISRKKN